MNLLKLSIKNIFENKGRSLTIGIFIFFVSFLLLFFNSFILSVSKKMGDIIINSLTGEIQLRSFKAKEGDMLPEGTSWDEITCLTAEQVEIAEEVMKAKGFTHYVKQVRHGVLLISDEDEEPGLVIGINSDATQYKKVIELSSGDYLIPGKTNQVILSEIQANKLKAKVGDILGVLTQTKDGYTVDVALEVVGIGKVEMLTDFGFAAAYMDLETARYLIGYENNEVSNIIIHLPERRKTSSAARILESSLRKRVGNDIFKVTTWENMGGLVLGILFMYKIIFYSFIGFLIFIICVLIVNIVYMMGLERYQDIGTLRAIGFSKGQIMFSFLGEIILIILFFGTCGIIVAFVIITIFAQVGMTPLFPAMEYLMGKRMFFHINGSDILLNLVIFFLLGFFASYFPVRKAVNLNPIEALRE